ncbi:hypothetical protein [Ottowia sp.]|uniref:hypothetical protein n=1 Tax=Ottowia sp. TaxID=1898956 RepID=UPI0025F18CB3|nr:hypothetical protein [Ottowia sp.]MBK6616664.1 hypothetical protein [Ottowia sp.]
MGLRYGVAIVATYPFYLALLWLWGRWLPSRDDSSVLDCVDPSGLFQGPSIGTRGCPLPGSSAGTATEAAGSVAGDAASGAVELVCAADEGVIVAVPLMVVVAGAMMLGMAFGFAIFGLFGVDVLLGVAVEIAVASVSGAIAFKAEREGWLTHALRRTAGPLAVVLCGTVGAGMLIEQWFPAAHTFPQVLRLLF